METATQTVGAPAALTSRRHADHAEPAASLGQVSLVDRTAWRDALLIWGIQRLGLQTLAFLGSWLFKPYSATSPSALLYKSWLAWMTWDAGTYASIAREGYAHLFEAAYFPLLPALEHGLAFLTGGDTKAIGPIIALAASLGAFGLLRVLVERELGRSAARRTLLYLALSPMALFFAAGYTESLFLLFSVSAFLALRAGRWLTVAILAALATLTRSTGILLLAPVAVECAIRLRAHGRPYLSQVRWQEAGRMAAALIAPVGALTGFMLYLDRQYGTTAVLMQAESRGWGRYLSWPWDGVLQASSAFFHDALAYQIHAALGIAFLVVFVVLAIVAVGRLAPAYGVYAAVSCAFVAVMPTHTWKWLALASDGRYMLVVFPAFMVLALWGRRRTVHLAVVAIGSLLLVVMTLAFTAGAFVG